MPQPNAPSSASSSDSGEATRSRRDGRKRKQNGKTDGGKEAGATPTKKQKAGGSKDVARVKRSGAERRPHSLSKAARDPRDDPEREVALQQRRTSKADEDGKMVDGSVDSAIDQSRSPSPVIDFDGLSRPSRGTRERLEETPSEAAVRLTKMCGAVRTLLECMGEDPDREGLLDTPARYAKAMLFFTKGYQQNIADIVNAAIFHEGHNEMVIVKDIEVFSLCEHHLVPFTGKMHIGYIPSNSVVGISKLPRIADMFARRLQIQERLTKEVANAIMETLKPQGVAVVMESSHLCMVMRGVEKTSSSTLTSCVLGCFEKKSKTRNEFFSLVGLKR